MARIIIGGTRSFNDYEAAKEFIQNVLITLNHNESITIISGGCRGSDKLGEIYATENGLDLEIYKANWRRYGRGAGPIRNKEMILASDAVICFWDNKSKGTESLIKLAEKYNKKTFIIHINSQK